MNNFLQTSIGTLPLDWDVVPLRDTCLDFFGGGTPSTNRPEFWDGDVAWTTSTYLNGLHLKSGQRWITEAGLRQSSSRVVPAGNLLIGTRVGVGKTAVNLIDIAISQDLTAGIIKRERFHPEFLAFYLQTNRCQAIFELQKRGATIKGIPREDLHRIEVAAPPLPEQRAIAAVLSKVQAAVEVQDKLVATLKELKAATMTKLFREGLRCEPLKQTEVGEIPESWGVVRLGEIAELITKGSSPNWQGFDYCETGVLFVRSQNIGFGELLLSEKVYLPEDFNRKERRSILSVGDLLINIVGASIGRAAVADSRLNGANINQAVALVRLPPNSHNPSFLMHFLISKAGLGQMHRQKKEIARANLSLEDVGSFLVPIPDRDEQDEIATSLEAIGRRTNAAEPKRDTLKSLFSSMLHLLMTGQVRVNELIGSDGDPPQKKSKEVLNQ